VSVNTDNRDRLLIILTTVLIVFPLAIAVGILWATGASATEAIWTLISVFVLGVLSFYGGYALARND
jgi:hypothetical protein